MPCSRTPENTHGLSQKIQGTYFKISALYFKIYALYFSPFQIPEKQSLSENDFLRLPQDCFPCYPKGKMYSVADIFLLRFFTLRILFGCKRCRSHLYRECSRPNAVRCNQVRACSLCRHCRFAIFCDILRP